jgi:hypothetical protein
MNLYHGNYTSYRYYQDGLYTPPAVMRCPYCRHRLPECDCGYGLLALDPPKPADRKGLKKLYRFLNDAVKKLFTARRHQSLLQPR